MRDLIDYFLIKLKNTRSTFILILCAFCFLLPFKMIYCNILSIVLLSIVILLSIINKKVYFNGNFKLFLILILPFIIQLIGFTYTKDYSSAVFSTEKRLGLLLFPLVFFFCKFQIHQDDVFKCITWFIWGLTFCLKIGRAHV